ncbi:Qat anti-phage system QueC-like protein QatC [Enterocloster lavalensis]|uniref:7-cyano-7-deazaguanine synthase (Queuosine biosynthesis) n=1 Tax=Enterocloster lavalensis TaxID=460384 RepID=A0A1I0J7F4_9FIRM|nr:Qat anti-phage system QueC-like protein QatC [Enterocloster lavalensis]SEU05819.1 7-cyano-7-deazaguanine synthase (queuosine biosynthesis) [Enterocloster lavalensis]
MNKVICYPRCCTPKYYSDDDYYFEMFTVPEQKINNVGHVGVQLFKELRKSKIAPTVEALDFTIIAMAVVAADKAVLRKKSADGWTRKIELCIYLHDAPKWRQEKRKLEEMLRFLSGDFWVLNINALPESLVPQKKYDLRQQDCICLLSGGMDSLVGAIDLHEEGRNPLFVSQTVRGNAEHQREYAMQFGINNLCQWSNNIKKKGESEISTRARSMVFFAFALLASCGIDCNAQGRKELFVPENGYISLNMPLDPLRTGSLSTKTTHPVYMKAMQEIWNDVGINIDFVLPYKYKTKGEVLMDCKNQDLMKKLIFGSTSCGKYQRKLQHCGVCVPCLVRRAAFLKNNLCDVTEGGYFKENLQCSYSKDVAAAALAVVQLKKNGIESLVKGMLSFAKGEERNLYLGVIERGVLEIGALLREHSVI